MTMRFVFDTLQACIVSRFTADFLFATHVTRLDLVSDLNFVV